MGRGSSGKTPSWKSQLKSWAKQGIMPTAIGGNRENQALVFREIDRLYAMPQVKTKSITQGETGVYVDFGNRTTRSSYPSGAQASEAEKRGVLKWILHKKA